MKKYFYSFLALICLVPFGIVSAMTAANGEKVYLQGAPIEGNAFLTGSSVIVDNEIKGDAFAFGERVYINGKINGDLVCAGKEIIINGVISGSVKCAFESMTINGQVERSVLGLGRIIFVGKNGSINRDLIATGEKVNVDGTVNGSLDIASSELNVNGKVKQNVNYYSEEKDNANGLSLNAGSSIDGDVNFNAFGDIKNNGASIGGEISKTVPEIREQENIKNQILGILGFVVALILTTLAIILIGGNQIKDVKKKMTSNVWSSVGIGAVSFFMLPIAGIILMITGMGAFLGIICFLVWILVMLLSLFFSGIAFGEMLIKKITKKEGKFLLNSILGILIGFLLLMIPYLGFVFFVFGLWWGIGGAILLFAEKRNA